MPAKKKTVIVITGASTGLGLAVAKTLSKRPVVLFLTARKESLARFAVEGMSESEQLKIRPLDVMSDQDRRALIDEINATYGGVDVLINNAGFTFRSVLEHVEQDELLQQMITNFWGPMELIRLVLPAMRLRKSGKIVNVSSVGGMMAMPTMSVYSASKFALEGASESLYYEVKPWNISVTLVEPGFIRSDSFLKVRYTTQSGSAMRDPSEPYFGHYRFMTQFIARLMRYAPGNAESVARKIVKVIDSACPPLRVSGTPDATLFDLLRRWVPRRIYHWLLYRGLPYPDCWGDVDRLVLRCHLERDKVST